VLRLVFFGRISTSSGVSACLYLSQYLDKNSLEIEEFDERPHIYRISAVIWVERPNQKAILLGKGGQAMKETATEARRELESFFQKKVFLRLWVKVKKSWSSDRDSLAQLGYTD